MEISNIDYVKFCISDGGGVVWKEGGSVNVTLWVGGNEDKKTTISSHLHY